MSIFRLALRNLFHKPWGTSLSLILAALGAGLISLLLLVSWQLEKQFERNLAGINLVIGAKGSPLQMILSSMYHVDAPTGNLPIEGIRPFLNPAHPYVETAVPLSLGDSYRGRRVVGTAPSFLELYGAEVAEGEMWTEVMEVLAGSRVAEELGLEIGDNFQSSHGLIEDSLLIHEDARPFRIVGILSPTGTVADQLLLTPNQSIWAVHGEHDHGEEEHDHNEEEHDHASHEDHNHEGHDHDASPPALSGGEGADKYDLTQPLTNFPEEQITSLLLTFKGNSVFSLNLQRSINENTNMQAATPSIEINRLYDTMGPGETILKRLALAIVLVSVFSIFISLYTSLAERKKELALMRSMGAGPGKLFGLLLTEGVLLSFGGALLGIILAHLGLYFIAQFVSAEYRYDFSAFFLLPAEGWLLLVALVIGVIAAFIPALQAAKTDVHATLAE
ncbi:hypothetical protein CEQ90_01590 [Lewinellaceae bacterium SD302]|nr:hypothetical protein CEQ90_01590 [Lewinellaceae bacterium SD302]